MLLNCIKEDILLTCLPNTSLMAFCKIKLGDLINHRFWTNTWEHNGSTHLHVNKLKEERQKLPIYPARGRLINQIQRLDTAIYLFEASIHRNAVIAVTQPRRVAAITVSQRVSEERGRELGQLVGYCVRFEDVTSEATKIKYMTDGMLLREAILDPLMKKYTIVILDEAHERTIHTDVLFGVVKAAQTQRKNKGLRPLKIVVMSATMDTFYSVSPQSDYVFSSVVTLFQIHKEQPPNQDVLIFLTGQEEIDSAVKSIKDIAKDMVGEAPPLVVCPLYAALPSQIQLRVFNPTPKGARKVIVATNIAETSVTIHVVRVSKAQALQRTGRAGRESAGSCYRLYTEEEFESFKPNTVPEIQRCNLSNVVLQLLAMGITDVIHFDFMDKPSTESILNAIEQLHNLGAITKEPTVKLSPLGRQMAAFPLDPRLEEMLSIVSTLSVDSREEAIAARKKFISSEGDHMTLLNIYRAFKSVKGNKDWCHENFINGRNMKTATEVRRQLREICVKQEFPITSCGQDSTAIRKCLAAGFFMNAAELQREGHYISLSTRKPVSIHPSSALFKCKPSYVVYNELVKTTKCYMRIRSILMCNQDNEYHLKSSNVLNTITLIYSYKIVIGVISDCFLSLRFCYIDLLCSVTLIYSILIDVISNLFVYPELLKFDSFYIHRYIALLLMLNLWTFYNYKHD
ncbi:LOW QUALITY PROTEIN: hypothetical protein KUTeg_007722 [Tegillarca granosa]|uniref:RNA helicase n=1 Tax=Tegillarca granosa TaxID=220873 RepID=A0ABQ9FGC4_TEGGR|nr:LOW QUALITY PROTEIN: hypothetical protein KUTeg_007722 [Tegillarca granosa]